MNFGRTVGAGLVGIALMNACSGSTQPGTPAPPLLAAHDIEVIRNADNTLLFARDLAALENPHDILFNRVDMGPAALTSLGPASAVRRASGLSLVFQSPLANTFVVNIPDGMGGTTPITLTADGALDAYVRDPDELYQTLTGLIQPTGPDFLEEISTPRAFPFGEVGLIDPAPFSIAALVSLTTQKPPQTAFVGNKLIHSGTDMLDPILPEYFWFPAGPNGTQGSTSAVIQSNWGATAAEPTGFGSIKALRFAQHGPCEIEQALQPLFEAAKVQIVSNTLPHCGEDLFITHISDINFRTVDLVPYISRVESTVGFATFQTVFGALLHGDLIVNIPPSGGGASSDCSVQFLYDYRLSVDPSGLLTVTPKKIYYQSTGSCVYVDDYLVNGLHIQIANLNVAPILTSTIPEQIQTQLLNSQIIDFSTTPASTVLGGTNALRCHPDSDLFGAPDCSMPAGFMVKSVLQSVNRLLKKSPWGSTRRSRCDLN